MIGAGRILDMLGSRGLRASWYVPGVVIETYPAACERLVAGGHEVGHHGWSHVPPASMAADKEAEEFGLAIESIRRLTGKTPVGYRSPAWDLSPQSIDLMLSHGIRYDSSMMGHDCEPYFVRRGDRVAADKPMVFGQPTDLVEIPVSWSLDDHPHFEFSKTKSGISPGLANANAVLENWVADFEFMQRHVRWGALVYTFHPYVIGRGHRMIMLTNLIDELTRRGAAFLTLDEVQQEFRQRQASTCDDLRSQSV